MNDKYRSRKFGLAVATHLVSDIALFTGFLDGVVWMQSQAAVLALYGASNIFDKKAG